MKLLEYVRARDLKDGIHPEAYSFTRLVNDLSANGADLFVGFREFPGFQLLPYAILPIRAGPGGKKLINEEW